MRAQDAYEEALKLYTEAKSIQLPNIDVPTLTGNTSRIKMEVKQHFRIMAFCRTF